jgi:hypothetical protein
VQAAQRCSEPTLAMHRYTITKRLGDGTYGEVVRASNKQTGEKVCSNPSISMTFPAGNLYSGLSQAAYVPGGSIGLTAGRFIRRWPSSG